MAVPGDCILIFLVKKFDYAIGYFSYYISKLFLYNGVIYSINVLSISFKFLLLIVNPCAKHKKYLFFPDSRALVGYLTISK